MGSFDRFGILRLRFRGAQPLEVRTRVEIREFAQGRDGSLHVGRVGAFEQLERRIPATSGPSQARHAQVHAR